jgi:hypothetical protein
MTKSRLDAAIARIDEANAADPVGVLVDGVSVPAGVLYGRRMSACLEAFAKDASEALALAVRAQHVERFALARASYPEGRVGYLTWRSDLAKHHAQVLTTIMRDVGYDEETITRAAFLVQKKALRSDADTQTLEDCACLVFLEFEYAAFAEKHEDEKVIDIVRKTWGKMSPRAHAAALALPLAGRPLALVQAALA